MAKGLQNYPNVDAPDSDHPNGNIRDNPGNNTGTPFNKLVYADIHQFFAKLLRLAGIAANNSPENETNGYQYMQAATKIFKRFDTLIVHGSGAGTIPDGDINPLVHIPNGSPTGISLTLGDALNKQDYDTVVISNQSTHSVTVNTAASNQYIGGTGSSTTTYVLPASSKAEFVLLKPDTGHTAFGSDGLWYAVGAIAIT